MKEKIKNVFKNLNFNMIATYLLILIATTISTTAIAFIFGASVAALYLPVNIIISCGIFYLVYKKTCDKKKIISNIGFSLIFFLLFIFIAQLFYDTTWDGNVYHKQTIGLIKNGMNPFYNEESGDLWSQHYSNGTEIWSGVLYAFTNNIETGKCINLLLAFILFIFTYKFVYSKSNKKVLSAIFAISISLNPLVLFQFNTYYIDGALANSLFISILALIFFVDNKFKFDNNEYAAMFICSSIICINTKFTALLIWGLFAGLLGGYILIVNLKNKDYVNFKKIMLMGVLTLIFSVLFVGSSTYVKNTVQHHNPFYPLLGNSSVDIKTGNESVGLEKLSHMEKWLYTTFSKTFWSYNEKPELKIPFTIDKSEIDSLGIADIKVAGLGIWYSGILCLSLPVILIGIVYYLKKKSKWGWVYLLLTIGIFAPIPVFPVVWQARYYPSLYLVPFLAIMILLKTDKKILKGYLWILLCTTLMNSIFVIPSIKQKFIDSRRINNQLVRLAEISLTEKVIISQDYYTFYGTYYNYIDKGIKYTYSKEKLENGTSLYYGTLYKIVEE